MTKKLIDTDVVLGRNTLLKEAVRSIVTTYQVTNTTDGGGQLTLGTIPKDCILLNWRVVNPIKGFEPREIGFLPWRFNNTGGAASGWWVTQLYVIQTGEILRGQIATVEVQYI